MNPKHTRYESEIIEFPLVIYDLEKRMVKETLQFFILPTNIEKITPFCTKLTGFHSQFTPFYIPKKKDLKKGITKEIVEEKGITLQEALNTVECKLEEMEDDFIVVCDGVWDMQFILSLEEKNKSLSLSKHFERFIDIQKVFSFFFPNAKCHPKQVFQIFSTIFLKFL